MSGMARVVFITAPEGEAPGLARALVGERLAACVNLIPGVTSVYRWESQIQEDSETLLVAKTTEEGVEPLTRRVRELHSYEVPEVVVLPVVGGLAQYLDWVRGECAPAEE